jgi:predicted nucleic acid-binding protein
LRELFALHGFRVQMPEAVHQALRWAGEGMDLADALHLALSAKAERFATFDDALVRQARKLGAQPPVSSV